MQPRALLISEEQGTGGIQTTLGCLRQELIRHGWRVEQINVRNHRPAWLTLVQQAQTCDVLIASNNFLPAYWAVLLGLLTQRPAVVWVHGPLDEVLQHSRASAIKKGFLQGIYNLASALVFASHASMDSFERAMPGVRQPVRRVIRNPAPPQGTELATQGPDTRTVQLGFVGRLSPEKRPEWLLQTLACLPPYCHLSIVGDGPLRAALQDQLQAAPHNTGLAGRVHFLGERAVSADTYRTWQASLLCSAYEGYPMAALESLAAGVPCIATPLPALRELLGNDAPHWIAAEDSPQSLARTVLASLQTPQGHRQALALGIAARHPVQAFGQKWQILLGEVQGHTHRAALPAHAASPTPQGLTSAAGRPRKSVHFIHSGSAYLPELDAYRQALAARGHVVHVHTSAATVPDSADVVWWMCGRIHRSHARRLDNSLQVHEYASASVAPWAWLKDRVKAWSHPRPDHRIFQSEWVRQRMGLSDSVPFSLRDMGVPAHFLSAQASGPADVDLVYLGEMSRLMRFVPTLQAIDQAGLRLLLVGQVPPQLQAVLQGLPQVQTTGRIAQADVPAQLLRARAGLNLVPDQLPLSAQTSTKMLEYLAVGLPVISNRSAWATQMAELHPDRITLLDDLRSAPAWQQALRQQPPVQAHRQHLQTLSWDAQLRPLPVWQALGL